MTDIKKFGPAQSRQFVQATIPGLGIAVIQLPTAMLARQSAEQIAERFGAPPIAVERDVNVAALYFEPHTTIEEHASDRPTLFMVIGGAGKVRVGGPAAQANAVQAGDAVLWPAFTLHMAWTDDDGMAVITVEYSPEIRQGPTAP